MTRDYRRGQPDVRRAPDMRGQGSFDDPVKLRDGRFQSIVSSQQGGSESEPSCLFDEELRWDEPLGASRTENRFAPEMGRRNQQPALRTYEPKREEPVRHELSEREKHHSGVRAYGYVAIIVLCFAGLIAIGVLMLPQLAGIYWKDLPNLAFLNGELVEYNENSIAAYKRYRNYMDRDVIYPGLLVDGVHVGDMTIEEARALLGDPKLSDPYSVTVVIGDRTWVLNGDNVPASRDLGNVLEKAHAYGRTNTTEIMNTSRTPFRERSDAAMALRSSGVNLTTTASYDHEAVRDIVHEIATYVTRDPIDAQIQSFDYNTRTFSFTRSEPGIRVDEETMYRTLTAALDRWEQNVTVTIEPSIIEPNISTEQMTAGFTLISAYTTQTTKERDRNINIDLACKAINGTALLPGETFSFNAATGQRTTAKGYRAAGAIAAGQSIEEVGGGICQVSSTIFNAVARADLEIVSRTPHAWPSTYVNAGEDATVNWPNLDFSFRNNTSAPVFLITYYKDRKMSAEIWGMTLGEGIKIELESKVVKTIQAPEEIKYVYNAELPYGTSKTTVKARKGYVVETYKVWYKDKQEIKRELLHTSTYKAYQQVVEYNE